MKFSRVHVVSGAEEPTIPLRDTDLIIWFRNDGEVLLDWWCGDGPWILWEKGKSIGECLKGQVANG